MLKRFMGVGEGQGPPGRKVTGYPTRDSSSSRRRYLLSMAWVRFSSCVETVSNSSSTAEEEVQRPRCWGRTHSQGSSRNRNSDEGSDSAQGCHKPQDNSLSQLPGQAPSMLRTHQIDESTGASARRRNIRS